MLNYILENLLPIIIAISGAIAWFFDKRKREAEFKNMLSQNKQQEATALQGIQNVYDMFVEDVKAQIVELKRGNSSLRKRVNELKTQLDKANEERSELLIEISNMREQSQRDAKLIFELKKKVEEYEKSLKQFRKNNNI